MWLNKLKIAIIEKNTKNINQLLDEIPQLDDPKEIEQALYLLREAQELLHTLKDETSISMIKMKKSLQFLRSTESQSSSKLNIKSS